jgi:DNA polymerase I
VQRFQREALARMGTATSIVELRAVADEVRALYGRYCDGLPSAPLDDLVVARRISTVHYARRCPERGAVEAYRRAGVDVAPGMTLRYVVRDARAGLADCAWKADHADATTIAAAREAWGEVAVGIGEGSGEGAGGESEPVASAGRRGCPAID